VIGLLGTWKRCCNIWYCQDIDRCMSSLKNPTINEQRQLSSLIYRHKAPRQLNQYRVTEILWESQLLLPLKSCDNHAFYCTTELWNCIRQCVDVDLPTMKIYEQVVHNWMTKDSDCKQHIYHYRHQLQQLHSQLSPGCFSVCSPAVKMYGSH